VEMVVDDSLRTGFDKKSLAEGMVVDSWPEVENQGIAGLVSGGWVPLAFLAFEGKAAGSSCEGTFVGNQGASVGMAEASGSCEGAEDQLLVDDHHFYQARCWL